LEPSSNSGDGHEPPPAARRGGRLENRWIVGLDRAAVGGLLLGLALYVLPLWREGRLRWAFFVTLISTLLHIYTSHQRST
jgi:hypothetical protein